MDDPNFPDLNLIALWQPPDQERPWSATILQIDPDAETCLIEYGEAGDEITVPLPEITMFDPAEDARGDEPELWRVRRELVYAVHELAKATGPSEPVSEAEQERVDRLSDRTRDLQRRYKELL